MIPDSHQPKPCRWCGKPLAGHPQCMVCTALMHPAGMVRECACGEQHGVMGKKKHLCVKCAKLPKRRIREQMAHYGAGLSKNV